MQYIEAASNFIVELSGRTQAKVNNEALITEQSVTVCKDYLNYRLSSTKLINKNGSTLNLEDFNDISIYLIMTAGQLEVMHPNVYKDVCRRLHVTQFTDNAIGEVFQEVANEIFKSGVTWAKIVSLFAFSGAFALDC
ncbi:bcl-2-related ovarian killer protein homolog A-like, partial [Saccoglossus kowalevskii]|uniref:Bcl-2-related ovarian killer protein homolog A-like n=1 Tax=Saccoglossus kowalevskii TaxID=10224 RepID=A0ABM0MCW1_SACKO